jgi:uncharacterized protein YfaS (alpha-2-macroglobulin family)
MKAVVKSDAIVKPAIRRFRDVLRAACAGAVFAAVVTISAIGATAQTAPAAATATATAFVQRPAAAARDVVVVPDRFLRRWDAITVFLPTEILGVDARDVALLTPQHPGAWSWLDRRTLQFAPAEPWPALERFTVQLKGAAGAKTVRLQTLLSPPSQSHPAAGSTGLDPIEEIALTFAEPIAPRALAQAVTIVATDVGGGSALTLGSADFEIKTLERGERSEAARYVLALRQPIPLGRKVTVRFRLSLDDAAERSFAEVAFATAEPFRVTRFGCRAQALPALAAGARYSAAQALTCEDADPTVIVDFSAVPAPLDTVAARDLVRLAPPVADLEATVSGKRLELRGAFKRETPYRVTLSPAPAAQLRDTSGRALELSAANELQLTFPRAAPFLRLARPWGVVERDGPQMVPVSGRGDERVDLRIHRIDPLDRSFWPLREKPVEVDEGPRPPGPGEEPEPWTRADLDPNPRQIAERIAALGAPHVSALVDLPLRRDQGSANFGLDLAPHLRRFAGADTTGSYLVGVRRLGEGSTRSWMRIDVTDLAVSALEEARRTVFSVTSLSTAKPLAGAEVAIEGTRYASTPEWAVLWRGTTDARGLVTFEAPGPSQPRVAPRRLLISKGGDRLALDTDQAPDGFADNRWEKSSERWLQWMFEPLSYRGAQLERLAHVFTERPVYRPDEPVHVKAFLRERHDGRLAPLAGNVILFVEGPGDLVWRYPLTPSASGAVYWKFDEADLPTGSYRARLETADGESIDGAVSFKKEAYRLPRFEVRLDAPERAPLDRAFDVDLTATYYAGGRVAARPIEWRVTQFPYDWTPASRPGFVFSSDARYSRDRAFESSPTLERADQTDEDGGAKLALNPTLEPTAQPRTYVVEATVIDADDQTVSATRQVVALPALLLGLKVPRYLEDPRALAPEILVLGPDEKPRAGEEVVIRLKRRRWHSHLRASDFSDGVARYVTEVVDEKVSEQTLISGADPIKVPLAQSEPGVYVVEVEGRDRLGRAQSISLDLFAGAAGDGGSVSWPKPATAVFQVVPDRARYKPGETARLVLESPFQTGEALAVVEAPDGNRVTWVAVRGGRAVFDLAIEADWTPRVPVHFLLMRGRLAGTAPVPGNATDLGRPATFGATTWLDVEPLGNRVTVELQHPTKAQPGQEVSITVRLKKPNGEAASGEVTLWLVDQAVMALGREQRLDPVPSFLTAVRSYLTARDSRALVFGFLPFALRPGGDEGEESKSLLDRQTIRKNFQPVPYYEPALAVGVEGATVKVRLPDDLTNFLVRAKATAGPDERWKRFGFATGRIEVRQPVVVQPSLPRFVRPGDRFTATAVGRLVEGDGGAGRSEIRVEGLTLEGPAQQPLEWVVNRATRIDYPLAVPTPSYRDDGTLERTEVVVRLGAERTADKVGDAVEVRLPLRDDRDRVHRRDVATLEPGKAWTLPEPTEPAREGSLKRKLLVSTEPGLVRLSAGLDFLLSYPYGCTEQRLATTRSFVALRRFRDLLHLEGDDKTISRAVADTVSWLPLVQQDGGLFAYWPGGSGSVSLTSWAVEFLAEAREAGFDLAAVADEEAKAQRALEQALRSDSTQFVDGESWAERTWALRALARAGKFDLAYGNELARRAQFLDLENLANVLLAFERAGRSSSEALPPLEAELWKSFATRLHQGREIYGGLQERRRERNGLILPSETRTVSEMSRALTTRADNADEQKKLSILTDALVALGDGDGWGDTNANASAILALSELLAKGRPAAPAARATLSTPAGDVPFALGTSDPTGYWVSTKPGKATLTLAAEAATASARAEASYLPAAPGSQATPRREGFVVTRELEIFRGGAGAAPGGAGPASEKVALDSAGRSIVLTVGDVVEDRVQVVNPEDRHYVAIVVPLAAGMEPLNPNLETAPPEAKPSKALTLQPTYAAYLDDQVAFYFDTLPKGTFDFSFRTRAQVPGTYQQPPAKAERMYDQSVVGSGAGALVEVRPKP